MGKLSRAKREARQNGTDGTDGTDGTVRTQDSAFPATQLSAPFGTAGERVAEQRGRTLIEIVNARYDATLPSIGDALQARDRELREAESSGAWARLSIRR